MVGATILFRVSGTAVQPFSLLLPPQPLRSRSRSSLSFNLEPSSSHAGVKPSLLPRPFRPNSIAARSVPPITAIFTGIVEEIGRVDRIGPSVDADGGFQMRIAATTVLGGVNLGDSISINGTCLTVSAFDLAASHFTVGLSPETLRRTALGDLSAGSPVNLERALQPESRMGGHFVQGHVDGTGEITSFVPEGDSLWVKVRATPELLRYVVPKGFIAVDGVSLTVVGVYEDESCFDLMLVAYTQQKVVIPLKKVADKVNLEVDILGKYVEKLLNSRFGDANSASSSSSSELSVGFRNCARKLVWIPLLLWRYTLNLLAKIKISWRKLWNSRHFCCRRNTSKMLLGPLSFTKNTLLLTL